MTQKKTGGPAFPIASEGAYIPDCKEPDNPPEREFPGHPGMTLRDYFAGQALIKWSEMITLQVGGEDGNKPQMKVVAEICYAFADAMIEARDK